MCVGGGGGGGGERSREGVLDEDNRKLKKRR